MLASLAALPGAMFDLYSGIEIDSSSSLAALPGAMFDLRSGIEIDLSLDSTDNPGRWQSYGEEDVTNLDVSDNELRTSSNNNGNGNGFDERIAKFISLRRFPQVWRDENHRKMAIDVLLCSGADCVLYGCKNNWSHGQSLASLIATLERFTVKGNRVATKEDALAAYYGALPLVRDINGGEEIDTIRFFARRANCSCLRDVYAQSKARQPKVGTCFGCKDTFERRSLLVCEQCKFAQYCSLTCQARAWPKHRLNCGSHIYYRKYRGDT